MRLKRTMAKRMSEFEQLMNLLIEMIDISWKLGAFLTGVFAVAETFAFF